jgi:hypothetical protein
LIEKVSRGHQAQQVVTVDDQQAADRVAAHQVGRLSECAGRCRAHHVGTHDVLNGDLVFAAHAAKISIGDDTDYTAAINRDQMTDAVAAHFGARRTEGFTRGDRHNARCHDVFQSHLKLPNDGRSR